MLTRRTILLGGSLTVISGVICQCHAKEAVRGCAITITAAKSYLGADANGGPNSIVTQSGNREFDYAAAQTLSKLTDTFNVLPGFLYFKNNSRNAYATPGRFTSAPDGTILFGRDLLFDILNEPEAPDAIFSGICAHEFAHILQFNKGLNLNKGEPNSRKGELHADFLAGYFAGLRKREKPSFPAAVVAVAHGKFGDYDFHDPQHHGTPKERSDAIVKGFQVAYDEKLSMTEAFSFGIKYVNLR